MACSDSWPSTCPPLGDCGDYSSLLHAVTYFSDETREALSAAGYRGFWMGYFAARAAPLGPVGPEIVTALFYNFAPSHVARAIPDAWDFAPPETALKVRQDAAVATLYRMLGDEAADAVDRAVALLYPVARNADLGGRALFAANAALPWPPIGSVPCGMRRPCCANTGATAMWQL